MNLRVEYADSDKTGVILGERPVEDVEDEASNDDEGNDD